MSRRRYELSEREWSIIASLIPCEPRGVPRVDDRMVLNGILWRFRTGSSWSEIPERYGVATTCYTVRSLATCWCLGSAAGGRISSL